MPLKFITGDVIISEDNKVWITELCPPLSCTRISFPEVDGVDFEDTICSNLSTLSSEGFKLVQCPQEPESHSNLLSHYQRDTQSPSFLKRSKGKIPKELFRLNLSMIIRKVSGNNAALWFMYFRDGVKSGDVNTKFSLLLKKLFLRLKINVPIVEAYSLSFACEQDKVIFWQLLKLEKSKMMIPKEIFRFSTFLSSVQSAKLDQFLKSFSEPRVIIKPTNSSLTYGALVLPKNRAEIIIKRISKELIKPLNKNPFPSSTLQSVMFRDIELMRYKPLWDFIRQEAFPDYEKMKNPLAKQMIDITIEKFLGYWLQLDTASLQGSEYDFFILEAYKQPREDVDLMTREKIRVGSRVFFAFDTLSSPLPLGLVYGKRAYKFGKEDFTGLSYCTHNYTNWHGISIGNELIPEWRSAITGYGFRDPVSYWIQLYQAFAPEKAWMNKLADWPFNDFLTAVRSANVNNLELLQYLDSQSIQDLNLENTEFCWNCFKISNDLKRCTACHEARYCDAVCQKSDWKTYHKGECVELKKE